MTERLSDGLGAFAMVPLLDERGPLLEALKEGRLLGRDVAALWVLIASLDWRTGRSWITSAELGVRQRFAVPYHCRYQRAI